MPYLSMKNVITAWNIKTRLPIFSTFGKYDDNSVFKIDLEVWPNGRKAFYFFREVKPNDFNRNPKILSDNKEWLRTELIVSEQGYESMKLLMHAEEVYQYDSCES